MRYGMCANSAAAGGIVPAMADGVLRCGVCGSGRLTPVAELRSNDGWHDRLRLRFARRGGLRPRPVFHAEYARACRDCGAVIPFLGEEERRALADDDPAGHDAL